MDSSMNGWTNRNGWMGGFMIWKSGYDKDMDEWMDGQ